MIGILTIFENGIVLECYNIIIVIDIHIVSIFLHSNNGTSLNSFIDEYNNERIMSDYNKQYHCVEIINRLVVVEEDMQINIQKDNLTEKHIEAEHPLSASLTSSL